jgi:hypothetical protein
MSLFPVLLLAVFHYYNRADDRSSLPEYYRADIVAIRIVLRGIGISPWVVIRERTSRFFVGHGHYTSEELSFGWPSGWTQRFGKTSHVYLCKTVGWESRQLLFEAIVLYLLL